MKLNDVTVVFTYYCVGETRRKYLRWCLNGLFGKTNRYKIPVLVVDGSPRKEAGLNKQEFKNLHNVKYFFNEESKPFKRCREIFRKIRTQFVLRILEDCLLLNFSKNVKNILLQDMKLLEENHDFEAVYYPFVEESKFKLKGKNFYYEVLDFNNYSLDKFRRIRYYNRLLHIGYYSYLGNSLLYRTKFFIKHWEYMDKIYITQNHAEAGKYDNWCLRIFNFSRKINYITHYLEYLFFSKYLLNKIAISNSNKIISAFHLGYYSTDPTLAKILPTNKSISGIKGIASVHSHLEIFKTINSIQKINFVNISGKRGHAK